MPCITGKAHRALVPRVSPFTLQPLEKIHLHICGPFIETIHGEKHGVHFLDEHMSKSDVRLLKVCSELAQYLKAYKSFSETFFAAFDFRIKRIRLDKSEEKLIKRRHEFMQARRYPAETISTVCSSERYYGGNTAPKALDRCTGTAIWLSIA